MLAPYRGGATAEPAITAHGKTAAASWSRVTRVTRNVTLVVTLGRDRTELSRFASRTQGHETLDTPSAVEPDLMHRTQALFFADEAHLDPRRALADLFAA